MLTDDKTRAGHNRSLDDNVNTRDQRRVGIVLLVLTGIFLAFLVSLGMSHKPAHSPEEAQGASGHEAPVQDDHNFDIHRPIGFVELPGTIGKPQSFTSGVGNTPAPFTKKSPPEAGNGAAPNAEAGATAPPKPEKAPAPAGH